MTNEFDKFAWIGAVRDDVELPDGIKYVLQNIAWTYVHSRGAGELHTRQATISDRLHVSVRQVKAAYAAARKRGYFVLVVERQRGRGHSSADRYMLRMPDIGADSAPINGGANSAPTAEIGASIATNRCTDRQEKVHETTEIGARPEAVTSDDDTPNGIEQGIEQGRRRAAEAAHPLSMGTHNNSPTSKDSPPEDLIVVRGRYGPRCPDHVNDPRPPSCGACGDVRRAHEARQQEIADRRAAKRAAAASAQANCDACDEAGWRFGEDGTVVEPAEKCREPLACSHLRIIRAATA